jgi:hypothetical protein
MTKYILCTGNITQGFRFFGIFESHEKAMSYGVLALGESGFIISELINPDRHFFEQIKGKPKMTNYVIVGYSAEGIGTEISRHDTKEKANIALIACQEGDDKSDPWQYFVEEATA